MSTLGLVLCICVLVPNLVFGETILKTRKLNIPVQVNTKALVSALSANASNVPSFNEYADSILEDLKEYSITYGLDPVELEDIVEEFQWKVLLITYKGQLTLTNGWMQGLSTIYRTDDVTVTLSDRNFNIAVPVSLEFLLIDYKYSAKFMGLGPQGTINARITGIDFILNLGVNSETNDFTLNSVDIKNTGNIKLKFGGNVLTDWLVNIFSNVITSVFRRIVVEVLEGNFSEIFQYVLDIINQNK